MPKSSSLPSLLPEAVEGVDALLAGTRRLRHKERASRDAWFAGLGVEHKADLLFELEILLKATACFGNPRNHPGVQKRAPVVSLDFRPATLLFRDGMQRAVVLARELLEHRDAAFVFHRYLETVIPEDSARTRLLRERFRQTTPPESLMVLRHQLTSLVEVLEGVLRAPRVPYRTFYALLSVAQQEVSQVTFFNPLTALEFRPEFDRIQSSHVLELIRSMPEGEAHRLVALTFLSLFRMLRYVQLLESMGEEQGASGLPTSGRSHLVLSVLRSDARALSEYLRRRTGELLSRGFAQTLITTQATELVTRRDSLRALGHRLVEIRGTLESIAGNLRIEMTRLFQRELPALDGLSTEADTRAALHTAVSALRSPLQNAVLYLGRSLGTSLEAQAVFDDVAARRESSDRLRRDVWLFIQILKAFTTKGQASRGQDLAEVMNQFAYVREFLDYFRSMGYPVLRAADYPRFDVFVQAVESLDPGESISPQVLKRAIDECDAFGVYLSGLFDQISRRETLRGVPFDHQAAKAVLQLHLGG